MLNDTLVQLMGDRESMPWHERRSLVNRIGETLRRQGDDRDALALAHVLAEDPKWEVRQAVGDILPILPRDEFMALASELANDSNSFVRQAAERALERRREGTRWQSRTRSCIEQTQNDLLVFERMYGKIAAENARAIAERWFEILVASTVHEIKGILSPLAATVTRLHRSESRNSLDNGVVSEGLAKMKDRIAFLERLVMDMRDYSRSVPPGRRCALLCAIIAEAQSLVFENLQANGLDSSPVRLFVNVPKGIQVRVARHQVVAAVKNVLKNAYEAYFRENRGLVAGEVHVRADIVADNVRIIIQDNGPGMAAVDLREVQGFVPGRTSKKNRGTGFGLPIARRYIMAHRGKIDIESREMGGTKVTIILPLGLEDPNDDDESTDH